MIERRLFLFCLGEKEKNKNSSLLFFVSFICFFSQTILDGDPLQGQSS